MKLFKMPHFETPLFHMAVKVTTQDYKGLQVELETTETCYTSFLSLKRPDFKNVIFKILEVSPCDSPAKQHSPFGPNQVNQAESPVLPCW